MESADPTQIVLEETNQDSMSSVDDLIHFWGKGSTRPEISNRTLTHIIEFALSATESETQIKVFDIGAQGFPKPLSLSGIDVIKNDFLLRLVGNGMHPFIRRLVCVCLANIAVSHEDPTQKRLLIGSVPGMLDALVELLVKEFEGRGTAVTMEEDAEPGIDEDAEPGTDEDAEPGILEEIIRCLSNLALSPEISVKIASSPCVLNVLVDLLKTSGTMRLLFETITCLKNLAELQINQPRIVAYPGALDALVGLMVEFSNATVRIKAVRCLIAVSAIQVIGVTIVRHIGVLDALVMLLGSRVKPTVQYQALNCLIILADHCQRSSPATCMIVMHHGVLEAIERLLRCNWTTTLRISVQKVAAKCLVKLASTHQTLLPIASHSGIIQALVKCLGPFTIHEIQNLAAECLGLLLAVSENGRNLVGAQPGAFEAILMMVLQNINPTGQVLAAWCLRKLLYFEETKAILLSYPGILDALLSLLEKDTSSDLLDPIIRCIASPALSTNKPVSFSTHPGVLVAIISLLGITVDSTVLEHNLRYLSFLARERSENARIIVQDSAALDALQNLLVWRRGGRSSAAIHPGVVDQTIKCLSNLAESEENQAEIASFPGIVDELWLLLVDNDLGSILQAEIRRCLAKLSESQYYRIHSSKYALISTRIAQSDVDFPTGVYSLENLEPSLENSNGTYWQTSGFTRQNSSLYAKFLDPITNKLICDPVKCSNSKTYDRWTIIDLNLVRRPNDSRRRTTPTAGLEQDDYGIEMDNLDLRSQLFECFPELEIECFARRRNYREEVLRLASTLKLGHVEDELHAAVEKLSNVLKFKPSDTECQNELERIKGVLEQMEASIDPYRWDMDPITFDQMCDPVKCSDGRTYDRWTIIDHHLVKCPYDPNLKHFRIVADDLNVRRRLFELFPGAEDLLRSRRAKYREQALEHSIMGEVEEAIEKLKNLLTWSPNDELCRLELRKNLQYHQEMNSKILSLRHEDLIREAKSHHIHQLTQSFPSALLCLFVGMWFMHCKYGLKFLVGKIDI